MEDVMKYGRGQQEAVVMQALEEYGEHLQSYPNVVGVGLAEIEIEGKNTGLYVVKVYVSKKIDITKLSPDTIIPRHLDVHLSDENDKAVPSTRVLTKVEEIGSEVTLEANFHDHEIEIKRKRSDIMQENKNYTVFFNAVATEYGKHLIAVGWCNESGWTPILTKMAGNNDFQFTVKGGEIHNDVITPFAINVDVSGDPRSINVKDNYGETQVHLRDPKTGGWVRSPKK